MSTKSKRNIAKRLCLFILVVLTLRSVTPAKADGIIVPDPPFPPDPFPMEQLEIKYHHVTITIENQIAVTHVDQVFYNPNEWVIEGTYLFPLPKDASVSDFV